jgi:thymidylate synthase
MKRNDVSNVRMELARLLNAGTFTAVNREASMTALVGNRTVEIVGACFLADQDALFGTVDWAYVKREEAWYDSMSRDVNDIPGGPPEIWKAIASKKDCTVNSNYGWCVYSDENGGQYYKVLEELQKNPESRRAVIIYTRPSMWQEYNLDGRSDFMCTNIVQYLVRDGKLNACVQMRSNDAVFGYKNDRAWQHEVLKRLAKDLDLSVGDLHWQVGSLHVYERHFYLVDHFWRTGEYTITKGRYRELYPASPYVS